MAEQESNITSKIKVAQTGIDLDSNVSQIPDGKLSYALNANISHFDANNVAYQNEQGNIPCLQYPEGYQYIGGHFIPEVSKHVIFLANPEGGSEIGYMENNDCIYRTFINADCLAFDVNFPIHKSEHRITDCTVEVYFTDGKNRRRFIDLNNPPYKIKPNSTVCEGETIDEIDCNKINVQPDFAIPIIEVVDVVNNGVATAGTVQFLIQYSDAQGNPYTSYYSATNPTPMADANIITPNFNYPVGKGLVLEITNIDISGYFEYFNLAVIKTINNIPSAELVGTYFIDNSEKRITYNGQNQTAIKLSIDQVFQKYPFYDVAQDLTAVQDVLVWDQLTSIDRVSYQKIANKIKLQWQSYRVPAEENYADELNATNLRGYLRDEVYSFEIVFLLAKGKETDGFHIPGRAISVIDQSFGTVSSSNPDFIGTPDSDGTSPYWKVYNTATVVETDSAYIPYSDYKGPYQSGEFAYWESEELYPCNEDVWGELANTPIRHHKFPDVLVSPIFENPTIEIAGDGKYTNLTIQKNAIFPLGVRINVQEIESLILSSNLTSAQKQEIVGFKIVRGNRDVNKSIVAKGILRNVGKYEREGTEYYFPNYPYNDLREDPFLLEESNAYNAECGIYEVVVTGSGELQYNSCSDNDIEAMAVTTGETINICSTTKPLATTATINVTKIDYDKYKITVKSDGFGGLNDFVTIRYTSFPGNVITALTIRGSLDYVNKNITVMTGTPVTVLDSRGNYAIIKTSEFDGSNIDCSSENLQAFDTEDSKYRYVFNSPETSFGQPFLGNIIKLENVLFGAGKAHFTEVKKNALYKLITKEAQEDALKSSEEIASIGDFSATAMFTAYQAYLQIYINGITRRNYGWSYNSILDYDYYSNIENNLGIKQRTIDIKQYLYPGVQSIGEEITINNYQRESSVYLRTDITVSPLPFASQTNTLLDGFGNSVVEDESRFINSQKNCNSPEDEFAIKSVLYYGSLKNYVPNQWGQMYSYETIDTGFSARFNDQDYINGESAIRTIFGGDTFINRFSFKSKLPFFIDNRVGAPDDSDIYYDEIGNVAYPEYWHSARSILYDYDPAESAILRNIISIKAHNFDCPNNQYPEPDASENPPTINPDRTYYDGKMYMFAYGIPTFYCETSINVDLRQAFNNREGDYFPRVSSGIPDDWLQESFVPIVQDNTYYYNVTYSKQNKENYFSHLPVDWDNDPCDESFPFRAIYSDPEEWLVYKPVSYFDFPQNYGKLTSLNGIQNKAILARFENKSLLYNTLLTIDTSNPQAAYLGNDSLFTSSPPIDFAETDLGYVGSQHKFLLKIPEGQITIDAKRGQVFMVSGNSVIDISALGTGMYNFFRDNLPFRILESFPTFNVDNHFKDIGLHGVYDSRYERVIITKLDYVPLSSDIKYDEVTKEFYINEIINNYTFKKIINVLDSEYFCNRSWSLSYGLVTKSWISFHSYLPNFYIAENNFFYSGINSGCDLEAIAAEEVPVPTTTSTTTAPPPDCELEGEIELLSCSLEGTAFLLTSCLLEGEAGLISSSTSTTSTTSTSTTSTSSSTTTTTTTIL